MQKLLIPFFFLITTTTAFGQLFEGEILYSNTNTTKHATITSKMWETMMGTEQKYYIRRGDYKSEMNGKMMQWQLYINSTNRLYTKVNSSEIILNKRVTMHISRTNYIPFTSRFSAYHVLISTALSSWARLAVVSTNNNCARLPDPNAFYY